jgi:hypothetical protein
MGEVEEELSEDYQVSMIEGKIETVVFTCSRMRGYQDIMKAFGSIWCWLILQIIKWRRVKHPFLVARVRRRREDSEEFEAIEIPFSLVSA